MGILGRIINHIFLCLVFIILAVMNPLTATPQNYETSQQNNQQTEKNLNTLKWLELTNKIMDLQKEGKTGEAKALAQIAYNLAISKFGDKSFEVASSLSLMASTSYEQGDITQSERYYRLANEIFESINLDTQIKRTVYSASLIGLNKIYQEQKNDIKSEELLLKSIKFFENNPSFEKGRYVLAVNYVLLGSIKFRQFKYTEYRDLCLKSIEIKENLYGLDSQELILPLMQLSEAYFHLGKYSYSIEILDRALKIAEKDLETENLLIARILNDQSASYQNLSYFNKSKELALKALEIKTILLGKDDPSIAITLNNLGIISEYGENNYLEALSYYQEALAIEKKAYGTTRIAAALYLENIGNLYERLGNYNEAESHIQDALRIYENDSSEAPDHSSYLMALTSLADLKVFQNKQNEAKEIYEKALKLARQNELNTNYNLVMILNSLGALYIDELDEPRKGLIYIDEALKLLNFNGEITYNIFDYIIDSVTMSAFINRASALTYLYMQDNTVKKDFIETIKTALNLMEFYRRSINDKDVRFNEWEKLSVFFELTLAVHEFAKFKDGKLPIHTFNFFESSISRSLTEKLSKTYMQTSKEIPSKVLDEEISFFQTREILQRKIIKGDSDENRKKFRNEYIQNEKQLGIFIDKLHKAFPSYAQINYPRPIELSIVQNELLSADKIALAYYLGSSNSFVMVITNQDVNLFRLKYNRDEILKKIKQLRNATLWYKNKEDICEISVKPFKQIKKDKKLLEEISNELYGILIEPVSQYLKDKKEIVIIPHSNLWLLPFEVIGTKGGEILGTKYQVSYQNSFSVWKLSHDFLIKKPENDYLFVGIGDAIYQNDDRYKISSAMNLAEKDYLAKLDTNNTQKDKSHISSKIIASRSENISDTFKACRWDALSLSKEEIKEITSLEAFKDKSESRFGYSSAEWNLDNLDKFKYVHFSTHGAMQMEVDGQNTQPALILTQINPESSNVDGTLTMEEVMNNLKLNADLVVLSACETGVGELKGGEGVMSMARAFQHAGAASVLTTLWKVHEDATKKFMVTFYEYLNQGIGPKEALYLTKKDFIEKRIVSSKPLIDYSHPFFWSAFVLIGGN